MTAVSELALFNGTGGFNEKNEYEIRLTGEALPPAPWINVIANPAGGCIVSETGAGPIWAVNSSQFRLTPWHNDPVRDRPGDSIYLRDVESGEVWNPVAAPVRHESNYVARHGAGYSIFEHTHDGIATTLTVGVPESDAVKVQILEIENLTARPRRVTVTSYVDWVLGIDRERTRLHVRTSHEAGINLAHNRFDPEFEQLIAFATITGDVTRHTNSRSEFLGRNGDPASPAWFDGSTPSVIADPCSVLETVIELEPMSSHTLVVAIGVAQGRVAAIAMAQQYREVAFAAKQVELAIAAWREKLNAITVETPERSFDLMMNQWALYQSLSSRVWGRIALYQSSGACGFRDQLQDVTAWVYAEPEIARAQIVAAASRQFEEGDVQHWWHPHSGRGIRTHFADDLAWLPFVVDHYLRVTNDTSVLEEITPYLHLRLLEPDEEEIYTIPPVSDRANTIYGHCVHALERACTAGERGLPLIKAGDWNDGMNRVGIGGKGESVWLAWFLIDTCRRFAVHAEMRGDTAVAAKLRAQADEYRDAIESTSWDGEWYRRAYYDDGTPIGSHVNEECQIDSIAQSWSVISGAGDPERQKIAMRSLHNRLVRYDGRLIMLLTPPFDRGTHDPGYIQGYLPGVRENGAQYTHAALWAVLATAIQGDGERAFELYQMINPITHAMTASGVDRYKVEPYVVAADVYTAEGHLGRGGWTWYTGSASWLYRVGLEGILGFRKTGDRLVIDPCIPSSWTSFSINYRFGASTYLITVDNSSRVNRGVARVTCDGAQCEWITLNDDGKRHNISVVLGKADASV
jgi:cyclic beta-1,2-glucan synthetase